VPFVRSHSFFIAEKYLHLIDTINNPNKNGANHPMNNTENRQWRLIIEDSPCTGARNMAVDRALMESAGEGGMPTLRFYRWSPPAVSLGKGQPPEVADIERCRKAGIDIVHRPTGGWAIFHTDELTYSVTCHSDEPIVAGPLLEAYRALSRGLIAGLQNLGLDASLAPSPAPEAKHGLIACFAVPYNNEITVAGKKLMGSAQARNRRRLLQHGSMPLEGDVSRAVDYLTFTNEDDREHLREHLQEHATTASAAANRLITFTEGTQAIVNGFISEFGIGFIATTLTEQEEERTRELLEEMIER
jgi:lipoate-protein ligase A